MARLYRKNFIEGQNSDPYEICNKVFAGWDFAIRQKENRQIALKTQLQLLINKQEAELGKTQMSTATKFFILSLHFFTWIWTIGVIVGIGFGAYYFLENVGKVEKFVDIMAVSGFVTLVMIFIPKIFNLMAHISHRGSKNIRARMYQTLVQTVLVSMTLILVIVIKYDSNKENVSENNCWENLIGQEMYRLLIMYFFGIVVLTFIFETIYTQIQPW